MERKEIKPYHYAESGLDNIYLANGFDVVETPRGESVKIRNLSGLHRAIGMMLATERKNLSGREFRFLRHEMNVTQQNLAFILGVEVQSVARWEKGKLKKPIDGPAQRLLRLMYVEHVKGNKAVTKPLQKLAELDEQLNESQFAVSFEDTDEGWQPSMAS